MAIREVEGDRPVRADTREQILEAAEGILKARGTREARGIWKALKICLVQEIRV